jgi:hypothetical protein
MCKLYKVCSWVLHLLIKEGQLSQEALQERKKRKKNLKQKEESRTLVDFRGPGRAAPDPAQHDKMRQLKRKAFSYQQINCSLNKHFKKTMELRNKKELFQLQLKD